MTQKDDDLPDLCEHFWCRRHGCKDLEHHLLVPACGHGCYSVCGCEDAAPMIGKIPMLRKRSTG